MTEDETLLEQIRTERQALVADMQRRREQLEREQTLAEAEVRNAERTVTKGYAAPRRRSAAPPPADLSAAWQRHIADRIQQSEARTSRASAKAIAQTIGQDVINLEKRCERLELELAELRELLKQDRSRGLRAVPSSPAALIA